MKKVLLIVSGLVALVAILGGLLYRKNHILQLGIANAEAEFANYVPPKVHDFGSVDHVSITPLQHNMAKLGIATIGTIPAELIIGKTYEQALAIHIKGK